MTKYMSDTGQLGDLIRGLEPGPIDVSSDTRVGVIERVLYSVVTEQLMRKYLSIFEIHIALSHYFAILAN